MGYLKKTFISLLISTIAITAYSQGNYERMGTQAFLKKDYKGAIVNLEKADAAGQGNAVVLRFLGYSYFQCEDYDNAISAYTRLIALKPLDYSSYYYRGKARMNVANLPKESLNQMRDIFYTSAIKDFTKAIEINGEEDIPALQNRGIAYKDYGIFKSYKIKKAAEKTACLAIFNNSISDFQKILTMQPGRKDIVALIDYVKVQIASIK